MESNKQADFPLICRDFVKMFPDEGAFATEHLQAYLEEFTFRFNRRTSSSRGQLFRRLLEQAVSTQPVTQADTLHGYHRKPAKIGKQTGGAK